MAKEKTKVHNNSNKLTKEEREHIDNMVVLTTAIGLVSAIALLYIYRWLNSSYILGTRLFVSILIWLCDAALIAGVVLYIVKKDRKLLRWIPYFAGGAFLLAVIRYFDKFKLVMDALRISVLFQKCMDAIGKHPTNIQVAFIFVYICIAAYMIATYIYYGRKVKKSK